VTGAFLLCSFKSGQRCLFITVLQVISWFINIELKQIYCSYSRHKTIQHGCLSFLLLFLRSTLLLNRNKNIGNDLLIFYNFPFPSTFLLPALPYRCFGVPEKKHESKKALLPTKHIFETKVPSKLQKCTIPPDHLGREISFSFTCNIPKHC